MAAIQIEQITLYPVKSLRGINLSRWRATPLGLEYDRQWMLVMPNGRFVTQRQLPRMALIDTAIDADRLHLSAPRQGSVSLPLLGQGAGAAFAGSVWRDECALVEASVAASAWLNSVLKPPQSLRLVHIAAGQRRPAADPHRFGPDIHTHFADAAPYLFANSASLRRLNQQLATKGKLPVDMRRFRPNLVVSGIEAFQEHKLGRLRHVASGLDFVLCDPCKRCIITTIDPDRGTVASDREPFSTLAELNPMPDSPLDPAFGVNATLVNPVGVNPVGANPAGINPSGINPAGINRHPPTCAATQQTLNLCVGDELI